MRAGRLIVVSALFAISLSGAKAQEGGGIRRLDRALDAIVPANAKVEKVHGGFQFVEGPVWVRAGGYLLFSDLMDNAIMKWTPDGAVVPFRKPVFQGQFPNGVLIGSNGLTLDPQGRLLAAEHGGRRVTRTEKDGAITVLADRYEGKRLNSPNDVVARKSGGVYFTDPPALLRTFPGEPPAAFRQELDVNGVYRVDNPGHVELVSRTPGYPNGLAFSPDEHKLYVANSRPQKYWMVFDVAADGTLSNGRKFFDMSSDTSDAVPDGMKVDTRGNLYLSGPGGVLILDSRGKQLGVIAVPEIVANVAWGDADGKTLYITARTSLYRIRLRVAGIRP